MLGPMVHVHSRPQRPLCAAAYLCFAASPQDPKSLLLPVGSGSLWAGDCSAQFGGLGGPGQACRQDWLCPGPVRAKARDIPGPLEDERVMRSLSQ